MAGRCRSSPASDGSPSASERTALVMTVIGWCSAIGCIQPGIESTGTLALDTNDSGKTSSDMPWAAWALPATRPSQTNIHMKANPNTTHRPNAASASATVPWRRNPTANPMAAVAARPRASRPVSATTRPASDGGAGHGQRPQPVGEALLHVLGHAGRGVAPGEQHAGDDVARHQEVDVGTGPGLDGPAEHVAEDQQEHRPGDRADHQQLRGAHELADGPAGDRGGGGDGPGGAGGGRRSARRRR